MNPLMWSCPIKVRDIPVEHTLELLLVEDQPEEFAHSCRTLLYSLVGRRGHLKKLPSAILVAATGEHLSYHAARLETVSDRA
jgi:hypothetical protein